jgi:hypothetical protein
MNLKLEFRSKGKVLTSFRPSEMDLAQERFMHTMQPSNFLCECIILANHRNSKFCVIKYKIHFPIQYANFSSSLLTPL